MHIAVLLAAGTSLAAASACSPSVPTDDAVNHPSDPTTVVLREEAVGGLRTPDSIAADVPAFSLYGDRTLIVRDPESPPPGGAAEQALPPLLETTASEELVQELLRFALGPGGLRDARNEYAYPRIADASTTVFTIRADGVEKTVAVEALGVADPGGPNPDERSAFRQLAARIAEIRAQVAAGDIGDVVPYDPPVYRVTLLGWEGGQDLVEWPWPDLTVDDFEPTGSLPGQRSADLERARVAELASVPTGGVTGIRTVAPDGSQWTVAIRPLLPDEL